MPLLWQYSVDSLRQSFQLWGQEIDDRSISFRPNLQLILHILRFRPRILRFVRDLLLPRSQIPGMPVDHDPISQLRIS